MPHCSIISFVLLGTIVRCEAYVALDWSIGMETVNSLVLRDESIYPDETVLKKILGLSYEVYENLIELFQKHGMTYEWRYYHDGNAWLGKVQKKKKTIVWMSAWEGYMKATIYFPLNLLESVLALDISEDLKEKILMTKNVGKSKPCIFEVRTNEILNDFESVMVLKYSSIPAKPT